MQEVGILVEALWEAHSWRGRTGVRNRLTAHIPEAGMNAPPFGSHIMGGAYMAKFAMCANVRNPELISLLNDFGK